MTVLTIGQATKAFMNEHVEWHRAQASRMGLAFHEATKRGELVEVAVALSINDLNTVKRVAKALLPVTSAIASALILDNEE